MKLIFTALRVFACVFVLWVVLLLVGINRAFAGFVAQQPSNWISTIGNLSERIFFAPQSIFGNGLTADIACLVWVFVLCLVASALYRLVRSALFGQSK